MEYDDNDLKLIYVLKIGYNSKDEGLYEFIFSVDDSNIDVEGWCWDLSPACDNAVPPNEDYINKIISLKTSTFDLFCLHEAVDREYMQGYHTIHALAYEIKKQVNDNSFSDYQEMFDGDDDDVPLLVFHYGMSLTKIKNMFDSRKITIKNSEFIEISAIKF